MEPLWNITMGEMLEKCVAEHPGNDAVLYNDRPFRKTFREFSCLVDETAKGFMALGVKKDDKVAVWATNYPEWLLTFFAAAKIGAVLVTVNTNYKIFEMEYLLKQSDTHTLVLIDGFKDVNYVEILNRLCPTLTDSVPGRLDEPKLPFLRNVIYVGKPEETPKGMFRWDELRILSERVSDAEFSAVAKGLSPDDVVNMQYTSGTTGLPKGVMLTHNNIINNGKCIGDCMKFTPGDRLCIPVPFFHCFGIVLGIMAAFTHSTAIAPVESYNPLRVMQTVQDERCTGVHGVPTMFIAMLEHPEFCNFDFSSLRTGIMAGSPCPVKVMRQVVDRMNMNEITIVYGLTESSPGCTQTTTDDSIELRVSTVGRVLPYVEARVVDPETGADMPVGEPGEFIARGYNIMKGYYKMPEATAQMIDADGWLHSGDLATVDENGYYKITGRIKDMIIRGGENIYPKEIEEFLYTHPAVKDVQVIGVPSEQYGEEAMACIILKDGESVTADEVKDYVRANMARHKVPRYVDFIDSFPMTASGKIQKYVMRDDAVRKLKLQDAANVETA